MKSKVAFLLTDGFEELEAVAPIDMLRRAGVEVSILSINTKKEVMGKNGITLLADGLMSEYSEPEWDMLVLPGGPGTSTLRENEEVLQWVREQNNRKGWLAAICAAPTVLHKAGILEGRKYTAHFSVADELPAIIDQPVVTDGHIITSMGAGTAVAFGLELVEALLGPEASGQIAESICEPAIG